jgi:hypothetical protein
MDSGLKMVSVLGIRGRSRSYDGFLCKFFLTPPQLLARDSKGVADFGVWRSPFTRSLF